MAYQYTATGLTCDSITKTFTHGLSRATNSLWVLITGRSTAHVYFVNLGVNTVQVRAAVDGQTFDLAVQQWHSIQN